MDDTPYRLTMFAERECRAWLGKAPTDRTDLNRHPIHRGDQIVAVPRLTGGENVFCLDCASKAWLVRND